MFLHPGLFCSLLQWTLLALPHRWMTPEPHLGLRYPARGPHRLSDVVCWSCAVVLCPHTLPCLGRGVRQLPTKFIWCVLPWRIILWAWPGVVERRMIKPYTTAVRWRSLIWRQVPPLMCCSSNKSTGKQSIAAFSFVLPLPIFSFTFSLQELMKAHMRMSNKVLTNESFWCFSRSWIINTDQKSHLSCFTSHWVRQRFLG